MSGEGVGWSFWVVGGGPRGQWEVSVQGRDRQSAHEGAYLLAVGAPNTLSFVLSPRISLKWLVSQLWTARRGKESVSKT